VDVVELARTHYASDGEGLSIAYQTLGSGPPDIVLIPALSAVDLMWDEPSYASVLRQLAALGRLIMFDFRGMGASDPVPLGALPTPEAWMEDITVVLDAVGSTECHLVGNGNASSLAILFAAMYPARTKTLNLINPTARVAEDQSYPCGIPVDALEHFLTWSERTWGTEAAVAVHFPSRVDDEAFTRWFGRFQRASMSPSEAAASVRWSTALDMRAILPAVHAPTLVMSRRDCLMVSPQQGRYVADNIRGARFIEIPGRDYWFFSEYTEQVLDHISEIVTGHRVSQDHERALMTVMFTDIVGSTETVARLGDRRWAQLLDQHDAIASLELERHRGRKVNPTGDGLLATFDGPARAVRCALAIRDAVRELGLQVRAGVHTGEVELRGDDVGGIAVHIGQRVSALAPPGEVFASRTVADLLLGSGIVLDDRGERTLKGIPGRWRIFAATG
jgi:class 3 adenylate cyclase